MTLFDRLPHRVSLLRPVHSTDEYGGDAHRESVLASGVPAWVQNATDTEVEDYQRWEQRVTHRVWFASLPELRQGDYVYVTSGPAFAGTCLRVTSLTERTAGLGWGWRAMCEEEVDYVGDWLEDVSSESTASSSTSSSASSSQSVTTSSTSTSSSSSSTRSSRSTSTKSESSSRSSSTMSVSSMSSSTRSSSSVSSFSSSTQSSLSSASSSSSSAVYLLRDDFVTTESAPLASPRTCEPGPGALTATQNDGQLSISGGKLVFPAQATPVWGDQGFYGSSFARVAGRLVGGRITRTSVSANGLKVGVAGAASIALANLKCVLNFTTISGIATARYNGATNVDAIYPALTKDVEYRWAVRVRANGYMLFVHDGATWKLLWIEDNGSDATLYPVFSNFDGAGEHDGWRVVQNAVDMPPLAADSFNRSNSSTLGVTDGAGAEESGGSGVAWVETGSDWSISANMLVNNGLGSNSQAVVDVGESNVLAVVTQTTGAASNQGVQIRASDQNNCWLASLNVVGDAHELWERNAGTWSKRATTAVTVDPGTAYRQTLIGDGQSLAAYMDGASRVSYTSSLHQAVTRHGVGATTTPPSYDKFAVWQRDVASLQGL